MTRWHVLAGLPATAGAAALGAWPGAIIGAVMLLAATWVRSSTLRWALHMAAGVAIMAWLPLASLWSWQSALVLVVALSAWLPMLLALGPRIPWHGAWMLTPLLLGPLLALAGLAVLLDSDIATRAQVVLLAALSLLAWSVLQRVPVQE